MKLSIKLPLIFGVIVMVTSISIGLATYFTSSRTLEANILQGITAENDANAMILSSTLTGQLNLLGVVANRADIREMNMDWERIQPLLIPDVPRIGALDIALAGPEGISRYAVDNSTVAVGDREYFRRAMAGEPNIEVVFSRLSGRVVVLFAYPIFAHDRPGAPVLGMLIARMDGGRTLSDLVMSLGSSKPSGYHYLVDNTGTFIAHRNTELVTSQFNPVREVAENPALRSLADMITVALRERDGDSRYTYEGRHLLGHYTEVPGYPWLLFSIIERYDVDSQLIQLRLYILSIGSIFIVIGILLAILVGRSIAKPIIKVANILKDISEGEGDLTRVINIKSNDEVGSLAHFFNMTLDKIKNLVISIRREANSLSSIGVSLASNMTETAAAVNQITANIQSIKTRVINQSASVTETNATMEQVVTNINKLNEMVESQAASVTQSSSAIEEMFANIQSVVQTLGKNVENVNGLASASGVGRGSLHEVADDIKQIAYESESLMEINSVMENIASQTNLLSMNAAIEAAHAGDAGRGFAVVAGEIRKLAESSSKQSQTISEALKKIKSSIDKITNSTENVLGKFAAIETGVKTVAEQEENIRNAMDEQGQGSKQILEAISHLNEITQQVRSGSHEMLEGSREVITESNNLEKVTQEISGSMNEMALGVEEINVAMHQINDLSGKNRENIDTLTKEVSRFKVD